MSSILTFKFRQVMIGAVALVGVSLGSAAEGDTFGSGTNQFEIDFVTIPGSVGDGYGGQVYRGGSNPAVTTNLGDFRIGKTEITYDQWFKFQNELGVPVTGTPSNAYDREGTFAFDGDGNFVNPNRPVSGISWFEAAQFVNYLNTSNGYQPAYKFNGTQGTNAYTLDAWNATEAEIGTNLVRHKDAVYYLPNENEWVKAAFWNGSSIQQFATRSGDSLEQGDGTSGTGWNYYFFGFLTDEQGPWDVGSGSEELNGTFDMMGNVMEWTESPFDASNDFLQRVLRGGSYTDVDSQLSSPSGYIQQDPFIEDMFGTDNIGFRVAAVIPEPASMTLLAVGGLALLKRTRR